MQKQLKRSKQYQASRKTARYMHLAIAFFQLIYIYTPLHSWQYGLLIVQWVTFPLLILSGIWMMKGQKIWLWYIGKEAANENKLRNKPEPVLVKKAA